VYSVLFLTYYPHVHVGPCVEHPWHVGQREEPVQHQGLVLHVEVGGRDTVVKNVDLKVSLKMLMKLTPVCSIDNVGEIEKQ